MGRTICGNGSESGSLLLCVLWECPVYRNAENGTELCGLGG